MTELTRQERHLRSESRTLKEITVLDQYTTCIDALNELFELAPDQCYQEEGEKQGVGCCIIDEAVADHGLFGIAGESIKSMHEYLQERSNIKPHEACGYHQQDHGCVVDNLKSPKCAAHYCSGLLEETGYDQDFVNKSLLQIINGSFDNETGGLDLEKGWRNVNRLLEHVDEVKEEVKGLKGTNEFSLNQDR